MIRRNTVLVLGAGASMPYGYPSGAQLREMLLEPNLFAEVTNKNWLHEEDVEFFCERFLRSQLTSIDSFLARCGQERTPSKSKTLEQIGKMGISIALRREKTLNSLLQHGQRDESQGRDHWYQYLWNQLAGDIRPSEVEKFGRQQLTIFTFNYDLSLEFYLLCAMQATYFPNDHNAAREALRGIQIIHLYGELSGNPMGATASTSEIPYEATNNWRHFERDASSIRVIDEHREENLGPAFQAAQQKFLTADAIAFLGFGFDRINCSRLGIAEALKIRHSKVAPLDSSWMPEVRATLLGLETAERRAALDAILGKVRAVGITDSAEKAFSEAFQVGFGSKSEELLRRTGILQ